MKPLSDSKMLFKVLRNIALTNPCRSKKYIGWLKAKSGRTDLEFHHLFGSVHGLKSTDLLGVLRTHPEHMRLESHPEENYNLIPEAIQNLLMYVSDNE